MAFTATDDLIRKLFGRFLYKIPRNQREYVWNKDNWDDFISDIQFSTKNKKQHFLGSIVLKKEESINGLETFTVIDGQQRITTITLLLIAIMFILKKFKYENDYKGTEKYLKVEDDKNIAHNIFDTDYHLAVSELISAIETEPFGTQLKTTVLIKTKIKNLDRDKNVVDCFLYFINYLESQINSTDLSEIIQLKDNLLDTYYIRILALSDEDSYTIFEILNARGTALEDFELIKNFIMRYLEPESERDKAKTDWENMANLLGQSQKNFVKHYLIHSLPESKIIKKDIYKTLKKNVSMNTDDIKKYFEDLQLKAKYYRILYNPLSKDSNGNDIANKTEQIVYSFFKSKRQEQLRPLLLSLIHQKETENLSEEKYNKILLFFRNFFICYTLIGQEKSNTLTSMIGKYAFELETEYSDDKLNQCIDSFKSRIPSLNWFKNSFENIGYSNHIKFFKDPKIADRARLALKLFDAKFGNISLDDEEFSIEHILPDSKSEKHPENVLLGNLLPLERDLNELCKDKDLKEKIEIYKRSKYSSVKDFVIKFETKPELFNPKERLKEITEEFYNLFKM